MIDISHLSVPSHSETNKSLIKYWSLGFSNIKRLVFEKVVCNLESYFCVLFVRNRFPPKTIYNSRIFPKLTSGLDESEEETRHCSPV